MLIYTYVRYVNIRCHKYCTLHGRIHYSLHMYEMNYYTFLYFCVFSRIHRKTIRVSSFTLYGTATFWLLATNEIIGTY